MTVILRRLIPCKRQRQSILDTFSDEDREILKCIRTKFIIIPNKVKVITAITTQNGDQVFMATLTEKDKTQQIALQQIELSRSSDNLEKVKSLFQRRRHFQGNSDVFVQPIGLTKVNGTWCLVLEWSFQIQRQTIQSYIKNKDIDNSKKLQITHDFLTGVKYLIRRNIISENSYNITLRNLFMDDKAYLKIAYYGLSSESSTSRSVELNENAENRLIWNIGIILNMINIGESPISYIIESCFHQNPANRPTFNDILNEFESFFKRKTGTKEAWVEKFGSKIKTDSKQNNNVSFGPKQFDNYPFSDTDDTASTLTQL